MSNRSITWYRTGGNTHRVVIDCRSRAQRESYEQALNAHQSPSVGLHNAMNAAHELFEQTMRGVGLNAFNVPVSDE